MEKKTATKKQPDAMASKSLCFCGAIRKVGRHLTREYDHYLKHSGLKITQFSMLANISRNPGITITELARLLQMDQTTATRNLKVLEKQGYIVFKQEASDQRLKIIQISKTGRAKMRIARPLWEKAQSETRRMLGKKGVDGLIHSVKKLSE